VVNRVILIGRLVRDPEMRAVGAGHTMARFALAVDRGVAIVQGEREVDFIDIVTWRKLAEQVAEHLHRGRLVGVEGRLQTRRFENSQGKRRKVTEVVADRVRFLDRKPRNLAGDGQITEEVVAAGVPE